MRKLLIVLISLSLIACTTVRPVNLKQAEAPVSRHQRHDDLALGDQLTITLNSGEVVQLQVRELEADAIIGQAEGSSLQRRIPDAQIVSVERREVSGTKSWTLVTGTLVVLGVIVMHQILGVAKIFR